MTTRGQSSRYDFGNDLWENQAMERRGNKGDESEGMPGSGRAKL
jgi:hypothetical protein